MKKSRIWILLLALCLFLGLSALPASAAMVASGTCGTEVTWSLAEDGTLTISGSGAMDLGKQWERPWIDHIEDIKKVVVQSGVTNIGDYAFYGCVNLTEVVLSDTITAIRDAAFSGCARLKELHIPAGVKSIYSSSFDGCTSMVSYTVDPENQYYYSDKFGILYGTRQNVLAKAPATIRGTFTVPEGVSGIGGRAFAECTGLTGIVIPEGVTNIYSNAFYGCTGLTEVTLPGTVEMVGQYVFEGCTNLKKAVLKSGTQDVGDYMFRYCTALTTVTIPDSVQRIGDYAFYGCTSLKSIHIPNALADLGYYVFDGCASLARFDVSPDCINYAQGPSGELLSKDKTTLIRVPAALTSYTFPNSVTTLRGRAFHSCQITSIIIPKRVTVLSFSQMFYGCDNLRSIIIRSPITELDGSIFNGCRALQHLELPATLTSISAGILCGAKNLNYLEFAGTKAQWDAALNEEYSVLPDRISVHYNAGKSGHTVTKTVVKPTCGVQGYTLHTCKCGYERRSDHVPALLHNYKQTGVQDGYRSFKCSKCTHVYTDSDPSNTPLEDRNEGYQDYGAWSSTVESYLNQNADGTYTRIQFSGEQVYIEQYSANLQYLSTRTMAPELPLFGGYYTNGTYHFLVFGQENLDENSAAEVIRVVKYDRNWKRLGSASLCGANTQIPFDAGSLRMVSCGNALYIRTSHQMFESDDGRNHQANLNLIVNISDMTISDDVGNSGYHYGSYVSHSFNQFIIVDGDDIVALDHGDGFPRCMVLSRLGMNAGETKFSGEYERAAALWLAGAVGKNATGATVGGLEASSTHYLTAGISIAQDGTENYRGQHNLYVTATGKQNFTDEDSTTIRWLTNYPQGEMKIDVSTPHLVKISSTKFCVLWTETNMDTDKEVLCYAFLNSKGKVQGKIYRSNVGLLSDCKPIVADGKILWYVTRYYQPDFYYIDLAKPGTVTRKHDHSYIAYADTGSVKCVCDGCRKTYKGSLAVRAGTVAVMEADCWDEIDGEQFQWYYRTSSDGKWIKCTAFRNRSSELHIDATCAKSGYQYRCKITDARGKTVYTKPVTLYVLGVKTQPTAQAVKAGATAKFKVTATGVDKSYQWQYRTSEDGTWQNATAKGNKTATLHVSATVAKSGFQYRCKITDSRGNVIYTRGVKLYILGIKTQPTDATVKAGASAKFKVVATGLNKSYQWQYKAADGTWKNCTVKGSRTAALAITATKNNNGRQYRCKITDARGNVIYSNTVKLTVK